MTVNYPHAMFHTGTREYQTRPPSNCPTARRAWDILAADGPIKSMMLIEGYWSCARENGNIDGIENTVSDRYV